MATRRDEVFREGVSSLRRQGGRAVALLSSRPVMLPPSSFHAFRFILSHRIYFDAYFLDDAIFRFID